MKKIIFLIVFISLIFPSYSQEKYENSPSGFYINPFVGYSFGPQKGVSTGIDFAYKFSNGICLGANASYNLRKNEHEPRTSCILAYEMPLTQRMLVYFGIGAGAAFPQQNPVYPFLHCRLSFGVNVWKDIIAIYFGYDSKLLFASSFTENSNFEHGLTLNV